MKRGEHLAPFFCTSGVRKDPDLFMAEVITRCGNPGEKVERAYWVTLLKIYKQKKSPFKKGL